MSPSADHTAAFHVIHLHTGPSADSQHTTRMALFKLKSEPSILPRRARPGPLVPTSHHGSDADLLADSPRLQCHLPSHNAPHLLFPHLCSLLGYKRLSIWLTVTSLGLVWDRHPISSCCLSRQRCRPRVHSNRRPRRTYPQPPTLLGMVLAHTLGPAWLQGNHSQ